ncbi:MAG: SIMPL domain-containing protein [Desulfovibrionaceae bacterium]
MRESIVGIGIGISIIILGFLIRSGFVEWKTQSNYVEVRGLAERKVLADKGRWSGGFQIQSKTIEELKQKRDSLIEKIQEFFISQGFDAGEITIAPIQVTDRYADQYNNNRPIERFSGTVNFVINTENVEALYNASRATNSLVDKGIFLTNARVQYNFTKLNDIKVEMLQEATENARGAALTFTKDSGTTLSSLQNATQGLFSVGSDNGDEYSATPSKYKIVRVVTRVKYGINDM